MKQASLRDDGSRRFNQDSPLLAGVDAAGVAQLVEASGDLALLLDEDGVIRDVSAANDDLAEVEQWVGQSWSSIVTIESRPKVEEILNNNGSTLR